MDDPRNISSLGGTRDNSLSFRQVLSALPFFLALFASTLSAQYTAIESIGRMAPVDEEPYRPFVFGVIYLLAAIVVLLNMRRLVDVLRHHSTYLLFLTYALASAIWSEYPLKVLITWGHLVGSVLIALSVVFVYEGKDKSLFKTIVIYAAISITISIVVVLFFPSRGIMDVDGKLRWVGLTATSNTLGIIAMISVWASAVYFLYVRKVREKIFLSLLIVASAVCLYGSDSITASVLALAAFFFVPTFKYVAGKTPAQMFMISISALFLMTVCIFTAYVIAPNIFDVVKLLNLMGRDTTFTGRTTLWDIAVSAIADKPILGWSFDALMSLSAKYRIHYGQFHDGYLDLLVRGGWVGMLFIIFMVITVSRNLSKVAKINAKLFAGLGVLLIIVLVHNVTEASLGKSPSIIWLLFTLMYFYLGKNTKRNLEIEPY